LELSGASTQDFTFLAVCRRERFDSSVADKTTRF
jgi:hypothetical protein